MTTISPTMAQLARLQWLLREGAKQAGIEVSDMTTGKLALQISRLMIEQQMGITWLMAPLDAAKKCQRKADIALVLHERFGSEGWLLMWGAWEQQAREFVRMSAYGEVNQ